MPTAPTTSAPSSGSLVTAPTQANLLMALADMHMNNRIPTFEERAAPVKDAIRSGEFDPVGMNNTTFEAARVPKRR